MTSNWRLSRHVRLIRYAFSAVGLAAALVAGLLALPAGSMASSSEAPSTVATSATAGPAGAVLLPPGHFWTVTLITGDVVTVRTRAGHPPLVTIRPGPGRSGVIFSSYTDSRGNIRVVPRDVVRLVGTVLDPTLFDVTALIQNGDDNAHRASLPLIVQGAGGATGTFAAHALSASLRPGVVLSSINAVAATEVKATASRVGHALTAMASAVARVGRATPQATGRVGYIWLDRTVRAVGGALTLPGRGAVAASTRQRHARLDHNLVQIGAPTAWRVGDTGRGVRVAVLDTGVDASHPDLRGQIVAERNFSHSHGVTDRFGHGTFVAAQIAGTGRASGGERRGVAFGARLLIGKVLNDDGFGQDSAVIAGMQWAATRARIVSMSLGGGTSDGTDPLSEAVNKLTSAHHVLFVIAAGNIGPSDETVSSPGAATAALTVGAVDGRDRLAFFSSRGPRPGNLAIKPDIVAPGVNIVGARAAGTTMGTALDALYTTASGTSMATPEVAGAAAILAAVHPRWSPAQLAGDLVSTAHRATGGDIYALGGGRLDIAAAVTDPITADQDVADLGQLSAGSSPRRVLRWTNTSRRAVTIDLSVSLNTHAGHPAPAGAVSLSVRRVRIRAGGSASAALYVHPRSIEASPGIYEGEVVARDGRTTVRTPIGLYLLGPLHVLTIRATPLPGTGANGFGMSAVVIDLGDPDAYQAYAPFNANGVATLHVPTGRYWVIGEVDDLSDPALQRSAIVGTPEVAVNGDTTVTLDGAAAVPISASVTGRTTEAAGESIHIERAFAGQVSGADLYYFGPPTTRQMLYIQPTGPARTGTFDAYSSFRLISPGPGASPFAYDLYHLLGTRVPASAAYVITPAAAAQLAQVHQRFYALDGNTTPMAESRYGLTPAGFLALQYSSTVPAGSTRTDYLSTEGGILWDDEVSPPIREGGTISSLAWTTEVPQFVHYRPGSTQSADWAREPFRPGPYSATVPSVSFCAPQATTRSRGNIHVELVDLQDLPDGFDCLGGVAPDPAWQAETSRVMRLYRDGRLVGTAHTSLADFLVPPNAATFRLSYADHTAAALPVSPRTSTTWTFRSAPDGLAAVRIPLLLVSYHLPLGLNNRADGQSAVFTAARVAGTPRARVVSMRVWVSVNNGHSWQSAPAHALGDGRFAVTLPPVSAGQAVSTRVQAADAGGSAIDQTIMTAYHG